MRRGVGEDEGHGALHEGELVAALEPVHAGRGKALGGERGDEGLVHGALETARGEHEAYGAAAQGDDLPERIEALPHRGIVGEAFDGYGEKVEEPGEVRKAVERGLRAVAGGQLALLDVRLKPVEEIVERGEG